MKSIRSIISVAAFLLICWVSIFPQSATPFSIDTAPIQNNGQPVNDFANVIDDAVEQQLNQKIKDFMKRTNPPVVLAVATVRTTGDRPIFDYSLAVARGWKIGSKTDDNPSALLFVAIDDRKYQTQISRDLEDELPDGLAGQLQRQYLVPAFKQGDYTKGISDTIDAYIRTIEAKQNGTAVPTPEATPENQRGRSGTSEFSLRSICCFVGIIVLLIIIFSRAGGGGGNNRRGGGFGGGGFGGGALPWIIGSILANSGNSSGSSWGGGGGSSWGGGSSGGGSDWGGFGGGGDFGGGGAGGDW